MQNNKSYKFKVDNDKYSSNQNILTGRQILEMAGKTTEKYLLILKGKNKATVAPDDSIDLSEPGVEKFRTIARECKEGLEDQPLRRQFDLPAQDTRFLNSTGLRWEAVKEGNVMRTIIYDYPIPESYNVTTADIYIRISDNYPDSELDMIYVSPALSLTCGKSINRLTNENFDGKNWQRWSRHRVNKAEAWNPALDGIESHLVLVDDWFALEVKKCT